MCKSYYNGSSEEIILEKETKDIKQTQLTAEAHLNNFLAFAQQHSAALAIYRLPNDSKLQIICDLSGGRSIVDLNLEDLTSGFYYILFKLIAIKSCILMLRFWLKSI